MMLYVLHDKYTIIYIKTTWREHVVHADVREKGFSTHNATYRGVNLRTMSDVKDRTLLRGRLIAAPNNIYIHVLPTSVGCSYIKEGNPQNKQTNLPSHKGIPTLAG